MTRRPHPYDGKPPGSDFIMVWVALIFIAVLALTIIARFSEVPVRP
jgi:hypothetical protein